MSVMCSCIGEASPAGDFAVSHCDNVRPLALELLVCVTRIAFQIAQHRDVLAGLDEFSRLEDRQFLD